MTVAIEPFDHGMLAVGDGHRIYWERCGEPLGKPAVVLHGGPGTGCSPMMRTLFDPRRYHVVLFDQRGAGRSRPHASEADPDLRHNTTHNLIADIEALREHLGIERWLVLGTSWGSTLALAYAERFPRRVSEIVLGAVTMTRRSEVEWFTRGVGAFLPEPWQRLRDGVWARDRDGSLAAAYARLLVDPDRAVQSRAARAWCEWEDAIASYGNARPPDRRREDPDYRLGFARLVTHYFSHAAWLAEDELLVNAGALAGIPGVLIHGELDVAGPPRTAWELASAWPGSELEIVAGSGHWSPAISERVAAATSALAGG